MALDQALLLRGVDGRDPRGRRSAHRQRGEAGLVRLLTNPDDHPQALRITRSDSHHSVGHGLDDSAPEARSALFDGLASRAFSASLVPTLFPPCGDERTAEVDLRGGPSFFDLAVLKEPGPPYPDRVSHQLWGRHRAEP